MGRHRGKVVCVAIPKSLYESVERALPAAGLKNVSQFLRAACSMALAGLRKERSPETADIEDEIAEMFDRCKDYEAEPWKEPTSTGE